MRPTGPPRFTQCISYAFGKNGVDNWIYRHEVYVIGEPHLENAIAVVHPPTRGLSKFFTITCIACRNSRCCELTKWILPRFT